MVLYLDLPCTSFHYGTSVSKHNIFTLCCFAAELNALFPTAGALASKYSVQYLDYSFLNFILSVSVLNQSIKKEAPFSFVQRCWQLKRNTVTSGHSVLSLISQLFRRQKMLQGRFTLLLHQQGQLSFFGRVRTRGSHIPWLPRNCLVCTHWNCCWGSVTYRTVPFAQNQINGCHGKSVSHAEVWEYYFWLSGMLIQMYFLDLLAFCFVVCLSINKE